MEYKRANFRGETPRLRFFMGNATPGMIAAVDLGSNSFHMIVAKTNEDSFHVVDRMRGMVQLSELQLFKLLIPSRRHSLRALLERLASIDAKIYTASATTAGWAVHPGCIGKVPYFRPL